VGGDKGTPEKKKKGRGGGQQIDKSLSHGVKWDRLDAHPIYATKPQISAKRRCKLQPGQKNMSGSVEEGERVEQSSKKGNRIKKKTGGGPQWGTNTVGWGFEVEKKKKTD